MTNPLAVLNDRHTMLTAYRLGAFTPPSRPPAIHGRDSSNNWMVDS